MSDTKQSVRELRHALEEYITALRGDDYSKTEEDISWDFAIQVAPSLPAVLDRLEELDGIDHPHQARDCYFKISRDYYRELWETSCAHVGEACEILGVDPKETPADTWTLREAAARMVAERDAIRAKFDGLRKSISMAVDDSREHGSTGSVWSSHLDELLTRFPALDSSETTDGREG